MEKKDIKTIITPFIYLFTIIAVITSVYFLQKSLIVYGPGQNKKPDEYTGEPPGNNDDEDGDEIVFGKLDEIIVKPFTDKDIKIVKDFYDYEAESSVQEKSLKRIKSLYLQNLGVDYSNSKVFDVIAVLSGTVMDVRDDETFGKIIEIKHENGLTSIYQSLSATNVKKGDVVNQGEVIGKSGKSNIDPDLGNHLHFELIKDGENVNPGKYYNKKVKDL